MAFCRVMAGVTGGVSIEDPHLFEASLVEDDEREVRPDIVPFLRKHS